MNDNVTNDDLMRCPTCGAERVSRYAAYCHVCGSPLPELPPAPEDEAAWTGNPPSGRTPAADASLGAGYAAGAQPSAQGQPPSNPQGQPYPGGPGGQPPPPPSGGVRVYDRPDVPPSQQRRKRLTIIMAVIGVLLSLLLLGLGPLRTALSARSDPAWTPPGTLTPAGGAAGAELTGTATTGLPPGMSAAQATARARNGTATIAPTWTPGVDIGDAGSTGVPDTGASPVAGLPTLAPAPTTTSPPPAATLPATAPPPTATLPPPTATAPPIATQAPPTATVAPTATATVTGGTGAGGNASLPAALAGGKALAFVSDRSGSPQVWVMDAAGANQIQVTSAGSNTSPSWSYDNRFLYYVGERDGQTSVYRLDITTGNEEALVSDPSIVSARPLPNGRLALLRTENGSYSLFAGDRRLFQLDRAFQFQFSPDGSRVVIDPNAPPRAISVVDVATTRAAEVAAANAWNAGWGPGNRLTYVSDRTGVAAVYVAGPNGEEPRPISPAGKWSQAPAFSSDGSQIAFIGGDGAAWNIYVVPATGGEARRAGGPANPGKSPAWQPAGRLIAYESNRAGSWDIYVTDPDGNERALTAGPGNDVDPAWTW